MSRILLSVGLALALIAGAPALALLAGTPALAQVNPFQDQISDLSPEDVEKLRRAALALYENPDTKVGTVERWENTISGNSGAVKLVGAYQYQGMDCRALQHRLDLASKPDPQFFLINRCKTADGTWKIL